MKQTRLAFALLLLSLPARMAQGQTMNHDAVDSVAQANQVATQETVGKAPALLDAQREKRARQIFLKSVQKQIVSAAEAMPADKFGFVPSDGEFKDVRSFGQQVKHLAATNYILAAAALGQDPPADAGDEAGPDAVRTKNEILDYLNGSFTALQKAIEAVGDKNEAAKSSPISPLPPSATTRLALIDEALIHDFDHYGQMVVYLRLNGVVPPASRP